MESAKGIDLSSLPSIYSKRKTRKCSSCKCLKPMDQFLPITINKKTVIPKTCQYCRSRRNSYYWSTNCESCVYIQTLNPKNPNRRLTRIALHHRKC